MTTDTTSSWISQFDRLNERCSGQPAWLLAMRAGAFSRFSALGFPTTRQEEWRFTNVAPIAEARFTVADGEPTGGAPSNNEAIEQALHAHSLAAADAAEIVVVNGRFVPRLSSLDRVPDGVSVRGLASMLDSAPDRLVGHLGRSASFENHAFVALNTAFVEDGAWIEIAPNTVVERPLHVLFVSVPAAGLARASHPRVLVVAGRNSQVPLVESYVTAGEGNPAGGRVFTNAVTELTADEGAVVDHYRVQREAVTVYHVSTTQLRLAHSATVTSHNFALGGALVRNEVRALLADEGGECVLNGLYLADGSRLVDNQTFIDHARAHCSSREIYKGILDGRARAVFNGKILVRPDAQKTDAKQTNKTLLLSDDAQINTKPQLEIYANDVKCTHGATVGQLSADALFYLQTRGIDRAEAGRMLVRAFAADITDRVRVGALREALDAVVSPSREALELARTPSPSDSRLPAPDAGRRGPDALAGASK